LYQTGLSGILMAVSEVRISGVSACCAIPKECLVNGGFFRRVVFLRGNGMNLL
jgi:hypothetical protein